jgi:hygromycin-B 7''-O-kinase
MGFDIRTAYLPADVGWHNWGRFFTDVQVWRPVVERICRQARVSRAERVEAGYPGSCAVFVVDDRVVVKLFPPLFPHDFPREREAYRLLDNRIAALPRILAAGVYPDQIDWPYLIFELRPGEPIREKYEAINQENRLELARNLGQIIRQVHQTPLLNVTRFDTHPDAWRRFLADRRQACLGELPQKTSLPESVLSEVGPFFESIDLLPPRFSPVLINADLTEDHLLLIHQAGAWRISALIDWADAEVGSPEYEWVAFWFGLCRQDAAMFREAMRVYDPALVLDHNFRRRMMAYTFIHRFGAGIITHVLSRSGNQPVHTLSELLERLWPPF